MTVLADGDESNSCDNDLLPPYHCLVSRSDSWSRPAGGNPVPADAGVPGSRPRFVAERRRAERGVESLFRTDQARGPSREASLCDLVERAAEERSRSGHSEGHAWQALVRGRPAGVLPRYGGRQVCMVWARTTGEAHLPGLRQRPLPEGSVTMPSRSSLSRMQGICTYGSKGGWETGLQRHHAPDYQWISAT
jgi:hypothetical protein